MIGEDGYDSAHMHLLVGMVGWFSAWGPLGASFYGGDMEPEGLWGREGKGMAKTSFAVTCCDLASVRFDTPGRSLALA